MVRISCGETNGIITGLKHVVLPAFSSVSLQATLVGLPDL